MSSWTERMHRRAATLGTVVTSCGQQTVPYPRRIEKVKFGFPLDVVCKNGIPGPLLVLILKLNKEAPFRRDVFRAPGHQGNIKKLVHFLQTGRLVNLDNFSIHTIASVLKKFLRKIPGGIFGAANEELLFRIIDDCDAEQQREHAHRLITSLPVCAQQMLVLLFGTFRVVATNADRARSGMTSEALGVSVAPSFFHSCVANGKEASHDDVIRFKVAMRVMRFLIDNFGVSNLFGRDNYEFYARITGRILKVEEDWIFSFRYPPGCVVPRVFSRDVQRQWMEQEMHQWGIQLNLEALSSHEECQSTPALLQLADSSAIAQSPPTTTQTPTTARAGGVGDDVRCDTLEGATDSVFAGCGTALTVPDTFRTARSQSHIRGPACGGAVASADSVAANCRNRFSMTSVSHSSASSCSQLQVTMNELRDINMYAESTKSLSFLPLVHERQTERMRTRSEWFLTTGQLSRRAAAMAAANSPAGTAGSAERCEAVSRANSRRLMRRTSSKKNKENDMGKTTGSSRNSTRLTHTAPITFASVATSIPPSAQPAPLAPSISQTVPSSLLAPCEESVMTGGDGGPRGGAGEDDGDGAAGGGRRALSERDCTEVSNMSIHLNIAYKPRI